MHAKRCKGTDCIPTSISHERARRDHPQRDYDSMERPRLDAGHCTRDLSELGTRRSAETVAFEKYSIRRVEAISNLHPAKMKRRT